jgi:hypothetical protein
MSEMKFNFTDVGEWLYIICPLLSGALFVLAVIVATGQIGE